MGPDILVTGDPDVIRHMNAPGSRWRRSGWYAAMKMDPRLDTVFSTQDESLHATLKAKEAGGVSLSWSRAFNNQINDTSTMAGTLIL